MSHGKDALTIEQLEIGLRSMSANGSDLHAFWDENIESFRRTLMFAIRDTSDALLSRDIPPHWRVQLENQLAELVGYIDLTDRYARRRALSFRQSVQAFPPASGRIH